MALFPAAQNIKGSAWYSLFAHAWLPRFFCGTWKLLHTTLCYTIVYHWITIIVTFKPYCTPSVRSVKALSLHQQTYIHCLLSLLPEISVPPTWEIFQLTLNSEQCITCLTSIVERQNDTAMLLPLYIADYVLHVLYRIFLRVTICKFSLRVTMNFIREFFALFTRRSPQFIELLETRLKHWT